MRDKSAGGCAGNPIHIAVARREARQKVHPPVLQLEVDLLAEDIQQCSGQSTSAFRVKRPHPFDVAGKVALCQEVGDDRLIQYRPIVVEQAADLRKTLGQASGTTRYPSLSPGNRTLLKLPT